MGIVIGLLSLRLLFNCGIEVLSKSLAIPVFFSMAIARLGCLLGGCCVGRTPPLPWGHIETAHLWPLWDIAALMLVVTFTALRKRRGYAVVHSPWGVYGVLRFGIEYLRDDLRPFIGLTTSQCLLLSLVTLAISVRVGIWIVGRACFLEDTGKRSSDLALASPGTSLPAPNGPRRLISTYLPIQGFLSNSAGKAHAENTANQ